jgi:putative oxidoreductase
MSVRDTNRADLGLALLRVVLGVVFLAHGYTKVFVWGLGGTAAGFEQMGIPLAGVMGPFIGLLELLGGLALVLGLATRWISLPLAATMVVATLKVHLPNGFYAPNGIEFTLMLFAGLMALALAGGGAFAVDNLLAARRAGTPARSGRLAAAS